MKRGLTSVTFRNKSVDEIIEIAKQGNLDGIEWGGDIHVPTSDPDLAIEVREKCSKANLDIFSYGSYFKAQNDEDFEPVLAVAEKLGAPIIRIWAGNKSMENISENEYLDLVKNVQKAADMAALSGIKIAFEYHRNTLTQDKNSALKIIKDVHRSNLYTYWQPNPDINLEEQLEEIKLLKDYICTYHVFAWEKGNVRFPLSKKAIEWEKYIAELNADKCILEFVKDDSDENFLEDCKTLKELTHNHVDTRKKAVLISNMTKLYEVYDQDTLNKLDKEFVLPRMRITSDTFKLYKETLKNAEYIFATWGMISFTEEEIEEYFPNLKAVYYGAGSVQAFVRPFLNKNVKVFSAWAGNAVPVAEFTIAQILLSTKGYFQNCRNYKRFGKAYGRQNPVKLTGNYNVKVGILGLGMIGKKVMELIKPYNINVLVYDKFADAQTIASYGGTKAELDEIFSECQVVSNHIANLPATEGMFTYEHFSKLQETATFINTGRPAQIVQEDMIRAFQEVPTRTALLDVEEPLEDNPLSTMENVFCTNHIAGSQHNEVARMGCLMYEEAMSVLNSQPCRYEVTLEMLKTMA